MIKLENLVVDFEQRGKHAKLVKAVDDVSLHIERGEVFGIVGASGAGKSTLLRTINLLERPRAGTVTVDGEVISNLKGGALRQARQKIGMIFQHFNLMHTRTVFDNTAFALRIAGKSKREIAERVPEILRLVGLEDKAQAYPSQLSAKAARRHCPRGCQPSVRAAVRRADLGAGSGNVGGDSRTVEGDQPAPGHHDCVDFA